MSMQEFIQYLIILRKRWWLLAVLCGVTLATVLIMAQMRPVTYKATVRFLVNVPPSSDVTLYPGFDRPSANQQIAATTASFMEVLRSPTVLERTREALGLSMSVTELEQALSVEKPVDSEFVWVTVTAPAADKAAAIANTVVLEAKNYYGEIQAAPSAAAREFISAQVLEAENVVARDRQALEAFKAEHKIGDLEEEISVVRTVLWNLVLSQSQANARGAANEVQVYERLIMQKQAELTRLADLSLDYETLQTRIARSQDYYQFLLDKETEAKLKENEILRVSFIQVVSPATAPTSPVPPYDLRLIALGLGASLVVGLVLIFSLEYAELQRRKPMTPVLHASPSQASD